MMPSTIKKQHEAHNQNCVSIDLLIEESDTNTEDNSVSQLKHVQGNEEGMTVSLAGNALVFNLDAYRFLANDEQETLAYSYIVNYPNENISTRSIFFIINGGETGPYFSEAILRIENPIAPEDFTVIDLRDAIHPVFEPTEESNTQIYDTESDLNQSLLETSDRNLLEQIDGEYKQDYTNNVSYDATNESLSNLDSSANYIPPLETQTVGNIHQDQVALDESISNLEHALDQATLENEISNLTPSLDAIDTDYDELVSQADISNTPYINDNAFQDDSKSPAHEIHDQPCSLSTSTEIDVSLEFQSDEHQLHNQPDIAPPPSEHKAALEAQTEDHVIPERSDTTSASSEIDATHEVQPNVSDPALVQKYQHHIEQNLNNVQQDSSATHEISQTSDNLTTEQNSNTAKSTELNKNTTSNATLHEGHDITNPVPILNDNSAPSSTQNTTNQNNVCVPSRPLARDLSDNTQPQPETNRLVQNPPPVKTPTHTTKTSNNTTPAGSPSNFASTPNNIDENISVKQKDSKQLNINHTQNLQAPNTANPPTQTSTPNSNPTTTTRTQPNPPSHTPLENTTPSSGIEIQDKNPIVIDFFVCTNKEFFVSGTIELSDALQNKIQFGVSSGLFGEFSINHDGNWLYSVKLPHTKLSQIMADHTVIESIKISTSENIVYVLELTIKGPGNDLSISNTALKET